MLREPLRGELARLDPARELRHRREGDVLVVGGQRAGRGLVRTKRSRSGPSGLARAAPDPSATRAPPMAPARPCAVRCGARRAAPSTCASCPRPSAVRQGSVRPARASPLRRTWRATTSGPTGGRGAERRRRSRRRRARRLLRPAARGGRGHQRDRGAVQELPARFRHAPHCSCNE